MNDPNPERDTIEQLAEEWRERLRRGERFDAGEYVARCPELAEEIRDLFDAIVMMEDLKPAAGDLTGAFTGYAGAVEGEARLERLGDFRILREVGRGGMGVVYEAEQESLGRRVALKVLPTHALADRQQKMRFQREARATARLHHTNIVPVYGVGEHEGMSYYVMQFIQGAPLDQVLDELKRLKKARNSATSRPATPRASSPQTPPAGGPTPAGDAAAGVAHSLVTGMFQPSAGWKQQDSASGPRSASAVRPASGSAACPGSGDGSAVHADSSARLPGQTGQLSMVDSGRHYYQSVAGIGVQVAEALEYANSQGIVHRDIKPSNLLLDNHGTVWVTDFGLAKALTDGDNLTHTGDIVGTLRYMAPERFNGQADARGDIYSLGLTLYELLVQQPAFAETDRNRLIHQVTHEEAPAPRKLNPDIPRDLETIVLKACDREPGRRYATAGALAEDLQRYLADRPIGARRVSKAERLWRWCRRNPALAGLAASVLLLLVVIAAGASLTAVHFQRLAADEALAHRQAQDAYEEAEKARASEAHQRQEAEKASLVAEEARKNEARQRDKAAAAQKLAQENFQEARHAVEQLLTRVSEGRLKNMPGMQPVRKELLQSALEYYQGFVNRHNDDPALKNDLADACSRLAGILAQIGSPKEALKIRQKAEGLLTELLRIRPTDKKLTFDLVDNYRAAAGLLRRLNDPDAALASLDKAYEQLLRISPKNRIKRTATVSILEGYTQGNVRVHSSNDPRILQAFADVLNDKGAICQARDPRDAIDYFTQALYIRSQRLANQHYQPGSPALAAYEHDLARQWNLFGGPYVELRMYAAALQYRFTARTLLQDVNRTCPTYSRRDDVQRDLAAVHENMGDLYAATKQAKPSLEYYQKALAYRERQARENPAIADRQSELTDCLRKVALMEALDNRPDKAMELLRRAIERQRTLVAIFPEEKPYIRSLAQQWLELAGIEQKQGRVATESYRQAAAALQRLPMSPASAAATVGMLTPSMLVVPSPCPALFLGENRDLLAWGAVLAGLGDEDAAMALLERATRAGATVAEVLATVPRFASLRAHPKFLVLLQTNRAKTHTVTWLKDFDVALAQARRENKDLFLYFGSSDSEPTGVWFQRNMLTHPLVAEYLNQHFVCVDLDRPRYRELPANHVRNMELINRWHANYFATMVLVDTQGRAFWKSTKGSSELGKWSSPEAFVRALRNQIEVRQERDRRLAAAEKISGELDRARHLEEMLQNVPEYGDVDYQDIRARIFQLDRDNRLGLRVKYLAAGLASGRDKIRNLLEKRQCEEALSECNFLLETLTLSGHAGLEELTAFGKTGQGLYLDRGFAYLGLGHFDRAAIEFARGQPLHRDNPEYSLLQAYVLVQLGDAPGYRRLCADLLQHYTDAGKPWDAFLVAWTCGMAPDAVKDWSGVIAMTEKSIRSSNEKYLNCNALGLLHYRAGNLAEAEKALRLSMAMAPKWRGRNELILALIEQRRNNPKQVRFWLDRFLSAPAAGEDALSHYDLAKLHATGYRDILVYQQLLEEAVVAFEGPLLKAFPTLEAQRTRGLMHLKQWDQALALLNKAIAADPENALRYLQRGRCYEGLDQKQKAAADFEVALKLKSRALEKARTRFESGAKGYGDRQALDDACREVAQIQERSGRNFDAAVTLGYLGQVWQGNAGRLFEAARDVAALVPGRGRDSASLTPEQRDRRRRVADSAISLLKQARDAGFLDRGRVLSDDVFQALVERDDFRAICGEMAMRNLFGLAGTSVIPITWWQSPPAVLQARNLAAMNEWDRAEAQYLRAVTEHPRDEPVRLERARFLAHRGKWRQAVAAYDLFLQHKPTKWDLWLERGRCHAMLEEWDQTAEDFVRALDLVPNQNGAYTPASRVCRELALWGEKALAKAVKMRPGDNRLLVGRARALYLHGQWREAAAVFSQVIDTLPLWEEWFEAAATMSLAGQDEAYRKLINELIRRAGAEPDPFIAYILARSCTLQPHSPADPAQVVRWAERAVKDQPGTGWYRHILGAAQYRAGNLKEAVSTLQESMKTGWGPEHNLFFLAMAYHRQGNDAEARKCFDKARALLTQAGPALPGEPARMFESDWLELNVISREAEKLLN